MTAPGPGGAHPPPGLAPFWKKSWCATGNPLFSRSPYRSGLQARPLRPPNFFQRRGVPMRLALARNRYCFTILLGLSVLSPVMARAATTTESDSGDPKEPPEYRFEFGLNG